MCVCACVCVCVCVCVWTCGSHEARPAFHGEVETLFAVTSAFHVEVQGNKTLQNLGFVCWVVFLMV